MAYLKQSMREIAKKIGERIKEAREEKGLTQKQLGESLGYSSMGISNFEQGIREIKVKDIHRVASFFGKDVSFFLEPSVTMFRADKEDESGGDVKKSLDDFDNFLLNRNKK